MKSHYLARRPKQPDKLRLSKPGKLRVPLDTSQFITELTSVLDPEHPAVVNLLRLILDKYDDEAPGSSERRREEGLRKYFTREALNKEANERLCPRPIPNDEWDCTGILYLAQLKIGSLLPRLTWGAIVKDCAFGPGATRLLSRREASLLTKLQQVEVTTRAREIFLAAAAHRPLWFDHLQGSPDRVATCDHGAIKNVPKNSTSDRIICIEPSGNMYLQKAAGKLMRRALKRAGVDLDDQSRNQEAARFSSIFQNTATVDLSSASDSISYWLVKRLLPFEWFCFLDSIRTPTAELDGSVILMEKFSAMGNGFTFELESLIFWAICSAVIQTLRLRDRTLCVYGDDIIIHVDALPLLQCVFDYVGFEVNLKKTHSEGPYRESCGAHWWSGECVKPFYLRRPPDDHETLFLLHNNLARWAKAHSAGVVDGSGLDSLLKRLRSLADPQWRDIRIPLQGYGDGAFAGAESPPILSTRTAQGWYKVPVMSVERVGEPPVREVLDVIRSLWTMRQTTGTGSLSERLAHLEVAVHRDVIGDAAIRVRRITVVHW